MKDKKEYILSKFPGKNFNSSGNLHAHCPFHDDSSPSFSINQEGQFICGSPKCGVKGGFSLFYKLSEGISSWREVKDQLKEVEVVNSLDVEGLYTEQVAAVACVVNDFPGNVEPIVSLQYFEDRGFSAEETAYICNRYGLRYGVGGWYSDVDITASLVVPIYDLGGEYRTFQVRYLDSNKSLRWKNALNSPNQNLLYGAHLVRPEEALVLIVEGSSDVWNLARLGVTAVGVFTKVASTQQKLRLVQLSKRCKGLQYVVCLDGDTHSQNFGFGVDYGANLQAELSALGLSVSLMHLKQNQDPGNLSKEELTALLTYDRYGGKG